MKRPGKKLDDQLVTRGMLKGILSRSFKKHRLEWKLELQREIHGLEYRISSNMDSMLEVKLEDKIAPLIEEMRLHRKMFQELADKLVGMHKNFETESVSIRQNYNQLEGRVKKVEEIVLPYQGQA